MPKLNGGKAQVLDWAKTCCELGDIGWYETSRDLMESFQKHAGVPASKKPFGSALRELGCVPRNYGVNGGRSWVGIKITRQPITLCRAI